MFRFYDVVLFSLGCYESCEYFMTLCDAVSYSIRESKRSHLPCGRYIVREVSLSPSGSSIRFIDEIRISDYIGSSRKRRNTKV